MQQMKTERIEPKRNFLISFFLPEVVEIYQVLNIETLAKIRVSSQNYE